MNGYTCFYCRDGEARGLHRGKWACGKCLAAFGEATRLDASTRYCGKCHMRLGPPQPSDRAGRCRCHVVGHRGPSIEKAVKRATRDADRRPLFQRALAERVKR